MGRGFTGFIKKHLDAGVLGTIAFGFALPTLAGYIWQRSSAKLEKMAVLGPVLSNSWGRAAVGTTLTAAICYGAMKADLISGNTALMANSVALVMFGIGALKSTGVMSGNRLVEALPGASLDGGYRGIAGYRGGYLGYLGNVDSGMGEAEMLPAPQGEQLFGMGAAPRVNVF